MKSKTVYSALTLVVVFTLLFCIPAVAQHPPIDIPRQQVGALPVGTEEPCIINQCLMYAGDFDPNGPNPNGLWNENANFLGLTIDGIVWVPVNVPKKFKGAKGKTDWAVTGLFVNLQNYPSPSATTANWALVQGVSAGGNASGNQVKTICSGSGPVSATPTGRIAFGFYTEMTYVVSGISCPVLEAGVYWMYVVPQVPAPPNGFEYNYESDVEDNSPTNIQGPGTEPPDMSYFTSSFFGIPDFTATTAANVCGGIGCDEFSVGVIGTATH